MNIKAMLAGGAIALLCIGYLMLQVSNLETDLAEKEQELILERQNVVVLKAESEAKDLQIAKQKENHDLVVAGFAKMKEKNKTYESEVKTLSKSLKKLAEQEGENHDWLTEKIPNDIAVAINSSLHVKTTTTDRIPDSGGDGIPRGT
jgi:septal ring factor EnvC (AmiA/AmiB activator)